MGMMRELLSIQSLTIEFNQGGRTARAVDRLDLSIGEGRALGLVGESGCGKTLTALAILRLIAPPGKISDGKILFQGRDLLEMTESEIRAVRGAQIGMIFQEPMSAFNPVFTIKDQMIEGLLTHHKSMSKKEAIEIAIDALGDVHFPDPKNRINAYPHQLSGGLRQRAMIAMAMTLEPRLILADEPTTALDLTIQAQIVDLINEKRSASNGQKPRSFMISAHDMGLIANLADQVAVIYAGQIAETAPVEDLFTEPLHPYSIALLESIPARSAKGRKLRSIEGNAPSIFESIKGCAFHPRCARKLDICSQQDPRPTQIGARSVRCWLF